jgi:phosphate transport system substrate-binding protein
MRNGLCSNFGNCRKADAREMIALGPKARCPECGGTLTEVSQKKSSSLPLLPIGLGVLALALVALGWFWFSGRKHDSTSATLFSDNKVVLRLHGSNTIGASLGPALVEAFLKKLGASGITRIPGKEEELSISASLPGESGTSTIEIHAHGSATAFSSLADGSCDIGMASRRIKPDEAGKLAKLGDMSSPASEHVLGLDGVAVIVNQSNKVSALNLDQVARVFKGEIADWRDVGGEPGGIHIFSRDHKSGTYDTFKTVALKGAETVSSAVLLEDSRKLSDKVASDANAIGFIGLPYILSSKAIAVSDKGTRPLVPSLLTVSTEDYLLSRRLYLYTPANPTNALTRRFVEFAVSKEGQQVVSDQGFIGQNIGALTPALTGTEPEEYRRLIAGAERLSTNFRFRSGSADLDNKALDDLRRVATFLADLKYTDGKVLFFGFADSTGSRSANCQLSKSRVATVASEFEKVGVHAATVTGFCDASPVGSNDSDDGRQRNRRVEIWVRK